jgi:dynactin complex subunit
MSKKTIKVGERCNIQDRVEMGTIRFVGATKFAAGNWVGIELDVPS